MGIIKGSLEALLLLEGLEKDDIMVSFAEEIDKLLLNHNQSDYEKALKIIEKMNQKSRRLSFSLKKVEDLSFVFQIWIKKGKFLFKTWNKGCNTSFVL